MKALLIVRHLPPQGRSTGRLALEYGKLLRAQGAAVVLMTTDQHGGRAERLQEGLAVKHPPDLPFFAPEDHLQATLDAVRFAKSVSMEPNPLGDGDLVMSFDWSSALVASLVRKTSGARMLHVYNGAVEARVGPSGSAGAWISEMERWALEATDIQVFPSESAKLEAERRFGKFDKTAMVIPTTVTQWTRESREACGEFRRSLALPEETVLLFLGAATRANGFDLFLDSLPAVIYERPTVKVVVVGQGPEEGELLERQGRLAKTGRLQVLGEVGDSVYRALLQVADMVVAPSRYDPSGLKLWEATAFDVPVVTLVTDCAREAVRDGCPTKLIQAPDHSTLSDQVLEHLKSLPRSSSRKACEQARSARERVASDRIAELVGLSRCTEAR